MPKKIFNKFGNLKKNRFWSWGIVLALALIIFPKGVWAFPGEGALNWILFTLIEVFGYFTTAAIGFLVNIASYNEFTTSKAVEIGWVLVRDIANMFFIVILMMIAISTIIRVESYNYKNMLGRLLVKAVLINFSKMFCGLLIDLSQIVTLTFVSAFAKVGPGNFIQALGLTKVYSLAKSGGSPAEGMTSTLLGGAIFMGFAMMIIGALMFVFLARVAAFWFLIVLSPLTFLLTASGGIGEKYADQWWSAFGKYLIVGPVLAFFLWLSLSIMSQTVLSNITKEIDPDQRLPSILKSDLFLPENISGFLVSIVLLIGSLVAAQEIGAAGASTAMSWAKGQTGFQKAALGGAKLAGKGATLAGAWGARHIKAEGIGKGEFLKGYEFNPVNYYRQIKGGLEKKRARLDRKGLTAAEEKAEEVGGVRGAVLSAATPDFIDLYGQGFLYNKGFKKMGTSKEDLKDAKEGAEKAEDKKKLAEEEHKYVDSSGRKLGEWLKRTEEEAKKKREGGFSSDADTLELRAAKIRTRIRKSKQTDLATEEIVDKAKSDKLKTEAGNRDAEAKAKETAAASATDPIAKSNLEEEARQLRAAAAKKRKDAETIDKGIKTKERNRTLLKEMGVESFSSLKQESLKKAKEATVVAQKMPRLVQSALAFQQGVAEEAKFVTSTEERELITKLDAAIAGNNAELATAIARQLTKVGGLNTYLNDIGEDANQDGLNKMIQNKFIGDMKMDGQTAYKVQNELGSIAKSIGHWTYAESTATKNGQLAQASVEEQAKHALIEMTKVSADHFFRNFNRLAVGGEDPSGKFHLNAAGAIHITNSLQTIDNLMRIGRWNNSQAINVSQKESMDTLRKMVMAKGLSAADEKKQMDILDKMEGYGKLRSVDDQEATIRRTMEMIT